MSYLADICRRIGNDLYKVAFPIYRPLYRAFKAYGDRAERRLLTSQLSHGCIIVDAGANIGVYSRFFSERVGPAGAVHSFEPSPENYSRLVAAVVDLPNVRANQLAVSDQTGKSTLYVSNNLNVDHRSYPTVDEPRSSLAVPSMRLDDYFPPGTRVDLIKMDIQGFEFHALRGAVRILQDNPQIKLLLEFWPYGLTQAGGSPEGFLSFLQSQGFTLFVPGRDGLKRFDLSQLDLSSETGYINLFGQRSGI